MNYLKPLQEDHNRRSSLRRIPPNTSQKGVTVPYIWGHWFRHITSPFKHTKFISMYHKYSFSPIQLKNSVYTASLSETSYRRWRAYSTMIGPSPSPHQLLWFLWFLHPQSLWTSTSPIYFWVLKGLRKSIAANGMYVPFIDAVWGNLIITPSVKLL